MQLKPISKPSSSRKKQIASSLAAATCSLLGAAHGPSVIADEPVDRSWEFDAALHYYGESDRVRDASATFMARHVLPRDRWLSFRLAVDTLTGSSANGAAPSTGAQTFTRTSGRSTYTTKPGETPLDPSFRDQRIALGATWGQPLGSRSRVDFGLTGSNEFDYFHVGINGHLSRDFNQRNSTLNVGLAFASDTIDPPSGVSIPLSPMLPPGDQSNKLGEDDKTVTDVMVGLTQVLGKRTIGQLNYGFSQVSGYLTDPYKLISVVDPVTGNPTADPGTGFLYLMEGRPDSRTKQSLFALVKHSLGRDVVDLSYRFMTDDWGIDSHTVDFHYRWNLSRSYIQPHLRYYMQSEADFYTRVLFDGDPLPQHASADYRLGDMDTFTVGAKYGRPLGNGHEWGLRLEFYSQSGNSPPEANVGALSGLDLFPTVDAVIFQAGYSF